MDHHDHMPTATASSDAAASSMGMDMLGSSDHSGHSMEGMVMVFFQSVTTPLYSHSWTPAGQGSYAGTCIFLIVLGLVHRVLIAARFLLFDSDPSAHIHRQHRLLPEDERSESVGRRIRFKWKSHPFRVATETSRALIEVIIGGVGYLL